MQVSLREWTDSAAALGAVAALGRGEVQVWIAAVPVDDARVAALASVLGCEEHERAARFRVESARREFVFSRSLLRQILGACLAVAPNEVALGLESRGKPFLRSPASGRDVQFNVSHSGGHVAIALTLGRKVGVDIESTSRLAEWRPLADRVFSSRELDQVMALPERHRRAAFFKGWTCKEAYLKATGEGLSDALRSIEVSVVPHEPAKLVALPGSIDTVTHWSIHTLPVPEGLAGAVAVGSEL